jgi:hypothetical protein
VSTAPVEKLPEHIGQAQPESAFSDIWLEIATSCGTSHDAVPADTDAETTESISSSEGAEFN